MRAERDDVPPLDQGECVVDLDDVLIELVAPREVLGTGNHGRRPREHDRGCGKRLLLERVATIVADARVGEAQLVHRFAEGGIELPDRRVGLAVEPVERVREPPRREAREADVVQGADVVVPGRQLMVAPEVEVGAHEVLVAVGGLAELGERIRARAVAVAVLQDREDAVHVSFVAELLAARIDREARRPKLARVVRGAEEERLVLDDRTADAGAELLVLELGDRPVVGAVADPALVAAEVERRPAQRVRAALRDRVDTAAGEAALTHVVGRDDQLDFLDGVEADRLRFRGAARRTGRSCQPEQVVVGRAVDLQGVVAEARARHRNHRRTVAGTAALRVEQRADAHHVGDAAGDGRKRFLDSVRYVAARAGDRGVDQRRRGYDLDRFGDRRDLQPDIHQLPLAQRDLEAGQGLLAEARQVRVDVIRAYADVQDVETALHVGDSLVLGSGRRVDCGDRGTGQRAALRIQDGAAEIAGGDGLCRRRGDGQQRA